MKYQAIKRTKYDAIPADLNGMRCFTGNSLTAVGDPDIPGGYQVHSYGTLIASVTRHKETGRLQRWVNPEFYSKTTTRQQNLCKANLPGVDMGRIPPDVFVSLNSRNGMLV